MTRRPPTSCSFVIPNYNGSRAIEACMNAVFAACANTRLTTEIIVVDDASADDSPRYLESLGDIIHLIMRPRNGGFASTTNIGLLSATGDVIILINNDVNVPPDIIDMAARHFDDANLFAVSFLAIDENGDQRIGLVAPSLKKGFLKGVPADYPTDAQPRATFFASGGGSAIDREKLLALELFDETFDPFYWEDVDLSVRALKRGWKVIYDPACRVIHPSHGSISNSCVKQFTELISRRNQLLFTWKNLDSPALWTAHVLFMALKALTSLVTFNSAFFTSLSMALKLLPKVAEFRALEQGFVKKSISKIISESKID